MATLSSSFFPPSNRRRCVKGRPSYAEPSDNFLSSIPSSKDDSNENFNQDLVSLEHAETEDVDEEPITIDLSAFLNENPLLAQAAFESSVENNAASTESSSQFRVTDCEVKPSEISAVGTAKSDFLDVSNVVNVSDNIGGNSGPPMFLANTLVSDSHDSVKENCLNIEPTVPAISLSNEPLKITINGKKSPIKKFNKAKPLGLSNPLKKYKNFMKVKDLNKTNLKVFGKYPVVKCEKLDIDNLVKSSKIKISNWPPHPVKNPVRKTFLQKTVGQKRSILAKGTLKPKVRKSISFTKYLVKPNKSESASNEMSSLLNDPFEGMMNPVVIKTDNWKPEITKVSAMPKMFRSPVKSQSLISRSVGGILNRGPLSENLTKSLICSKVLSQKSPVKTNGPIITSVKKVINSPKAFKLIAPKPILQSLDIQTVLPNVTKPIIETISEPVANEYTVIEPYVEDPTSPVKPKPILTVPIEVLSSPEKTNILQNVNISDSNNKLKTFNSVFINSETNLINVSSRPRKVITVAKKQILKKKINFSKCISSDDLKVYDKINGTHQSPEENLDVHKAKNAVVDAMQNVFTTLNKTKKPKSKLHKKSPVAPLLPDNTSNVSYSTTFNDLLFGFSDNDFEDVSFDKEDEFNGQSNISRLPDESLELSFKMPSNDTERNTLKAAKASSRVKKSDRRKKLSIDSPYTSDTLSASECENEPISRKQPNYKSKGKRVSSTPKSVHVKSASLPASATQSRKSSVSISEDASLSSSLSEDVNSSENNKIFDNKVLDSSPSLSIFGSSDEKSIIPSSPKNKYIDSSTVDVTDISSNSDKRIQHDVEHKENENIAKPETNARTLRQRKCSSIEVNKSFDNSSKQNTHIKNSDEKNSKIGKSSVSSKLKIQMKTPPRSTAKVKIKQKLSKPDDILQEINTITGGKLKLKKGLKTKRNLVIGNNDDKSIILNSSNQDMKSNLSPLSSSLINNPPSQTVLKKRKPVKVSFKRSKKKKRASSLKLSLKSSSDVIENNTSAVSENNESLHSSFREEKADKMENVNEENVAPDVDVSLDEDDGSKVIGNTVPNSDKDLMVKCKKASVDQNLVITKNSEAVSELDIKNRRDVAEEVPDDNVSAKLENIINDVVSENEGKILGMASSKVRNYISVKEGLAVENNAGLLNFESNAESCDTVINDETENSNVTSNKNFGISGITNLLSPASDTIQSVRCENTDLKNISINIDDDISTSCDSNNTEISTHENIDTTVGKEISLNTFKSKNPEKSNFLEIENEGDTCLVHTDSQETYEKSSEFLENASSNISCNKSLIIQNDSVATNHDTNNGITSQQNLTDIMNQKSSEIIDNDLSNDLKRNSSRTAKKCPKLKISFKNSGKNNPDKSWVVSESNFAEIKPGSRQESEMAGRNSQEVKNSVECSSSAEKSNATDSDVSNLMKKGKESENVKPNSAATSDDDPVLDKLNSVVIKEEPIDITEDIVTESIELDAVSSGGNRQLLESHKRRRGKSFKFLDYESSVPPSKKRKTQKNTVLPEPGLVTPKTEAMEQDTVDESNTLTSCDTSKFRVTKNRKPFALKLEFNTVKHNVKGKKKPVSTPASASSQKRRNYDSKLVLVPFTVGWMREHVIRASSEKRASDVYYFAPDGTKLRSMPDVLTYLAKHPEIELGRENFTYAKELIFREPFEIERGAMQKTSSSTPKNLTSTPVSKKGGSSVKGKKSVPMSSDSENSQATPITKKKVTKEKSTPVKDIVIKEEVVSDNCVTSSSKQTTLDKHLVKVTKVTKQTVSEKTPPKDSPKKTPSKDSPKKTPSKDSPKKTPSKDSPKKSPLKGSAKKTPLDDLGENKMCKKPKVSSTKSLMGVNVSSSESSLNDSVISRSSCDYSKKGKGLTKRGRPPKKSTEGGDLTNSVSSTSEIQLNDSVNVNSSCDINQNELSLDTSADSSFSTITSERTSSTKSSRIPKGLRVKWARKYHPILQKPCTKFCNFSYMRVPSIECSVCLCLFHAECVPYVFNSGRAFACAPCATNQTASFREECPEVKIPSDVDIELLYPDTSLHFYSNANFDRVFNKFYAPIDYSFRLPYSQSYAQSPSVPSNFTSPLYHNILPAPNSNYNPNMSNPQIVYVNKSVIQQHLQQPSPPSFSAFSTNINTVPAHLPVPFLQNVHSTNLPVNPIFNSSDMYRQTFPLTVSEPSSIFPSAANSPLVHYSGSKMITIKKIKKDEIPKNVKVKQMGSYVGQSNTSVLQTLLQSNEGPPLKRKSDSSNNTATVQKSMRFANPMDSQQYLTAPLPNIVCDKSCATCITGNRSQFSLNNVSPYPIPFPSIVCTPKNTVNKNQTASMNLPTISNYACPYKLELPEPHLSNNEILDSNLTLASSVNEPVDNNISGNNQNESSPQINILCNDSVQQKSSKVKHHYFMKEDGEEQNDSVLNSDSRKQNASVLDSDSQKQNASVLNTDSQEHNASILNSDGQEQNASVLNSNSQEQTANSDSQEQTANVLNSHSQKQIASVLNSDGQEQTVNILNYVTQEQNVSVLKSDNQELHSNALINDGDHNENSVKGLLSEMEEAIHADVQKPDNGSIQENLSVSKINEVSKMDQFLNIIFKFLNIYDLLQVSKVCHSWKKLATQKHLWEHVCFTEISISDWSNCCKALQKYETKSLDMRGIFDQDTLESWKMFSGNLQFLNNVETLIFEKIPPFVLKHITESLPKLRSLTCYCLTTVFTEPEIWTTPCKFELASLKNLNHLQKLKISSMGGVVLNHSPESVLPYLPNLTHIVLTGFKFETNMNLECLSQQKQLISLELGDCTDIEPKIYKLLAKLTNLKNLCLQNGGKLDDRKMPDAVSKMYKLENLELMNFKISNYLSEVLKNKDNLSYFSIWPDNSSQAAEVNFNSLSAVMSCKKLRGICWGILTDDEDVPNVLELRDPNSDVKDIHTMTFEELFQKLTSHFPGKAIEMKCLPRSIWSEFCSSRDFL